MRENIFWKCTITVSHMFKKNNETNCVLDHGCVLLYSHIPCLYAVLVLPRVVLSLCCKGKKGFSYRSLGFPPLNLFPYSMNNCALNLLYLYLLVSNPYSLIKYFICPLLLGLGLDLWKEEMTYSVLDTANIQNPACCHSFSPWFMKGNNDINFVVVENLYWQALWNYYLARNESNSPFFHLLSCNILFFCKRKMFCYVSVLWSPGWRMRGGKRWFGVDLKMFESL